MRIGADRSKSCPDVLEKIKREVNHGLYVV
jgi:hypothetical protein